MITTPATATESREITIILADGKTETVLVRELPVRQLAQFDALQGDEPALVELYCGKEEGWADTLSHKGYEEIAKIGDEINRPAFDRYIERLTVRLQTVKDTRGSLQEAGILPAAPKTPPPTSTAPESA